MFYSETDRANAAQRATDALGGPEAVAGIKQHALNQYRNASWANRPVVYATAPEARVTAFRDLDPDNDRMAMGHPHEIEIEYSPDGACAIFGVGGGKPPTLFAD